MSKFLINTMFIVIGIVLLFDAYILYKSFDTVYITPPPPTPIETPSIQK
jgi:hypothetical protein